MRSFITVARQDFRDLISRAGVALVFAATGLVFALATSSARAETVAPAMSPAKMAESVLKEDPDAYKALHRVVYHFDDAALQGLRGLRSMRNHLDVDPDARLVAVALGDGVSMLLEGAKDPKTGIEYAPLIADLVARGVKFEVCEITLKGLGIDPSKLIMEASVTRSGVVRIGELQAQGFGYIKP